MSDCAHQPVRITERGLDQQREQGERYGHHSRDELNSTAAWR
jgi:hypothetical protein